jgi:hypothetical protein
MTMKEKGQVVRQLLLSDPTNLGSEFDAFRSALRRIINNPLGAATVDELYEALPKQA